MAKQPLSIAKASLRVTGLFESELLIELMLRFWEHPLANDREFRNILLEQAADVLRSSVNGQKFFADIEPSNLNLVAAIWYAEWTSVSDEEYQPVSEGFLRNQWLDRVRRSLPSCFCNPDDLID